MHPMHLDPIHLLIATPKEEPGLTYIYWCSQDPQNEGPAWRTHSDRDGHGIDGGPLDFVGWSDGSDGAGRNIHDYFDGHYLGPDQHGVYPILV